MRLRLLTNVQRKLKSEIILGPSIISGKILALCLEGVATDTGEGFLDFLWIRGVIRLLSHWTKT